MTLRKKVSLSALSLAIFFIIVLLIIFPERYSICCIKGLELWLNFVVPSLFPFFILTSILTKLGVAQKASKKFSSVFENCFKMPSVTAYCFLMSVLSGYPVGSKLIADLFESGTINSKQATKMSILCSTSGPLFIIASVGSAMFKNRKIGIILFLSHLLSVIIISLIVALFHKKENTERPNILPIAYDNILYESVYGSIISILMVGAFISIFYILTQILCDFYILLPFQAIFSVLFSVFDKSGNLALSFVKGLLEATNGCKILSQTPNIFSISLTAFIITFGGACILIQQICYLKKAGVKLKYFIPLKILQAFASFALCLSLCFIFGY